MGQVANGLQSRYLKLMLELLDAPTSTVVYEAATSLTALTSNPVAVKAAAGKLIELGIREADNNVKLIVLDRVDQLRIRNEGVLDDLAMEILRVLTSPDIDVRRKALGIALEMVSSKNVEEIVMLLKKELTKTVDEQYEQVGFHVSRWTFHDLTIYAEQRIPPTLGPVNTYLRHQVLRDRRQRCRPSDGFHCRLQQQLCRGCHFIRQGSR
jgi:vesicle coat complex subunit